MGLGPAAKDVLCDFLESHPSEVHAPSTPIHLSTRRLTLPSPSNRNTPHLPLDEVCPFGRITAAPRRCPIPRGASLQAPIGDEHHRFSSRPTYSDVLGRLHGSVRIQATLINLKIEGFHPCLYAGRMTRKASHYSPIPRATKLSNYGLIFPFALRSSLCVLPSSYTSASAINARERERNVSQRQRLESNEK